MCREMHDVTDHYQLHPIYDIASWCVYVKHLMEELPKLGEAVMTRDCFRWGHPGWMGEAAAENQLHP